MDDLVLTIDRSGVGAGDDQEVGVAAPTKGGLDLAHEGGGLAAHVATVEEAGSLGSPGGDAVESPAQHAHVIEVQDPDPEAGPLFRNGHNVTSFSAGTYS